MMQFKGKAYGLLISFLFMVLAGRAQDQQVADSLARIYRADTVRGTARLELLRHLSFNEVRDLGLSLRYAEELIGLAAQAGDPTYLYYGYFQKGNKKRLAGDLKEALAAYFKSGEAARKAGSLSKEGSVYGAIADVYTISKHFKNARLYYSKAIAILRHSDDTIALASAILNAGDGLMNNRLYDSALHYFRESGLIFEQANYPIGKAYSLGNSGMVYANLGKNALAQRAINEAVGILEALQDYYPICVYLLAMADVYRQQGDGSAALNYARKSFELARQYGLKEQISDAALKLSQLYEQAGNADQSLRHFKTHITYRDSVNNLLSVQKMAELRTDYELARKQGEVDLLHQEKKNQRIMVISLVVILGLAMVILGTLYWHNRTVSREKKRSENLLLNILPAATARELKQNGRVEAVRFEEVTVLFTDFVAFSKYAEHVEPEQLVESIDFYFRRFDEITLRYGLEKIKTIGDSYMCAGGLPTPNPSHVRQVIGAAREMIDLVSSTLHARDGLQHFDIRIGIHTGPVVAGIVGLRKWQYDIWGDSVNIASRMESQSLPGRINLSESTFQHISEEFPCEYRGEIEVKNRGRLKMYFLS